MATSMLPLCEADVHGLVDGQLDPARRTDVLARLASFPGEAARIEAWRGHAALIRSAFYGLEDEPLPVALDLAPPRLRCIDTTTRQPSPDPRSAGRRGRGVTVATWLSVAICLSAGWLMLAQIGRDDRASDGAVQRLPSDTVLTIRPAAADHDDLRDHSAAEPDTLPAVRLPDLTRAGFNLISVATETTKSASLVLRYRDASDGRLTLRITRAERTADPVPPSKTGETVYWSKADAAFAMAGTLPIDRLEAIADSVRSADSD